MPKESQLLPYENAQFLRRIWRLSNFGTQPVRVARSLHTTRFSKKMLQKLEKKRAPLTNMFAKKRCWSFLKFGRHGVSLAFWLFFGRSLKSSTKSSGHKPQLRSIKVKIVLKLDGKAIFDLVYGSKSREIPGTPKDVGPAPIPLPIQNPLKHGNGMGSLSPGEIRRDVFGVLKMTPGL